MSNQQSSFQVILVLKYISFILLVISSSCKPKSASEVVEKKKEVVLVSEVNSGDIFFGDRTIAIVGVSLIDGVHETSLEDACVIVHNGIITEVGETEAIQIPENAEVVQGAGLTLMPGLIDAHFHYDNVKQLPTKFLRNGVTSVRDPGQWIEAYDPERLTGDPLPRLFLTGPHLDSPPPAYPKDSYVVRDKAEVVEAMDYLIDQGASGVKIYFRLPLELVKEVCDIAHNNGLPVTGHLEITDARQAILAGLDGIEHVTSLGTALISKREAEVYRQSVLIDNNERKKGRYEMWSKINLNSRATDSLIDFLVAQQTFVTPTLGAFEYRMEEERQDSISVMGFQKMMGFIGRCQEAGVRIVLGSHGPGIRYAKDGLSYQHEMWLFSQTGMDNMRIIKAATIENARFFRIDHRLGSIEKGKQADLILIEGDPIADINAMYNVKKVMLNGAWVD